MSEPSMFHFTKCSASSSRSLRLERDLVTLPVRLVVAFGIEAPDLQDDDLGCLHSRLHGHFSHPSVRPFHGLVARDGHGLVVESYPGGRKIGFRGDAVSHRVAHEIDVVADREILTEVTTA